MSGRTRAGGKPKTREAALRPLLLKTARNVVDLAVLSVAFASAFLLRFDADLPQQMFKRLLFLWPYVVALQFFALVLLGVPNFSWRYVGLREAARIMVAIAISSAVFTAFRFTAGAVVEEYGWAQYAIIPLGVIAADAALAFLGVVGVRVLRRLASERSMARRRLLLRTPPQAVTLLVGAGRAGVQVARELSTHPDLGLKAVGFIDDDPAKQGTVIHGIKVIGRSADLVELCRRHEVEQVVITIAAASGATIRSLLAHCDEAGVPAKIIPGISEILDGRVNLSRIREVSIEDLLGRDAVHLEMDLVGKLIAGRSVLVTGAGGSIGSELCRQIARMGPSDLILVERAEPALFAIFHEMSAAGAGTRLHPTLCDVCDADRVARVFGEHRPAVVFHAAAHKHVPMMEWNPGEAIKNNVFGTRTLADAADRAGVETFVLISTDKAVNPTSVMGASKRVAELYLQALSSRSETRYVAVRFGNVLGSTGSVIPIFKRQIEAGGPVTVTHPDMRRYFMTIPEASQLVMQAGAMGQGGEIFVLDMGEPVHIVDLARDLIKLSGFVPDEDIAIEMVGLRPGEKLFEELGFDAEHMDKTRHPKIWVGRLSPQAWGEVLAGLEVLKACTGAATPAEVYDALRVLVPELQVE